jgi:hypothetical protein
LLPFKCAAISEIKNFLEGVDMTPAKVLWSAVLVLVLFALAGCPATIREGGGSSPSKSEPSGGD